MKKKWDGDLLYSGDCLVRVKRETKEENIVIREGAKKIEAGAFTKCENVKTITIPDSVTYLDCEAMSACERLETVNIDKGVSLIHDRAISGSSLKSINVNPENEHFSSEYGVLYNKDKTELYSYPENKNEKTFCIPDSVKVIKSNAIRNSENLEVIYVGKNIEKIEACNFYGSKDKYEEVSERIKFIIPEQRNNGTVSL